MMKNYRLHIPVSLGLTILLIGFYACSTKETQISQYKGDLELVLPTGFDYVMVADSVGRARQVVVNSNGDIYIALQALNNGHGLVALRDLNGDGKADSIVYFGSEAAEGLHIHKGYLYVGTRDRTKIVRFRLIPDQLLPDMVPEVVVSGFKLNNTHGQKSMAFDGKGNMFVNEGAPSNACYEETVAMDPCPLLDEFAIIFRYKDDVLGQDKLKDGYKYVTGVRNAVALEWNAEVNQLYAVQHGRDRLHQLFPDMYSAQDGAELPSEEFFLLTEGTNYGWPYCYYDHYINKKVLAPDYGGDRQKQDRCEGIGLPIMAFPGHLAPNDLIFYNGNQFPDKYKNGAFIAFHGSWNRAPLPQEGYFVVFVPFNGELPSGDWEIFANGFKGIETVVSTGEAKARPCGLALTPDGSLIVTDSRKGRVYMVYYTGK